ncbi:MAG: FmdB family zinc ribbon protein [Prosthecobacter sp.]
MPTYDYECQTCGHKFEARQSMKDPHLTDCPQEGCAGPVKRKIGLGAGLIFKGSGFYITDYRSDSYKAAAKKDSESSSGSSTAPASSSSGSSSSTTAAASSTPAPAKTGTAA